MRGGQLKAVTTNLQPGCYFKHGIPYSGRTVLTEYFTGADGDLELYLAITTMESNTLLREVARLC